MSRLRNKAIILFFLLLFFESCSQTTIPEVVDPLVERGRYNAIQKAHLLTDICFIPQNDFQGNGMVYQCGVDYVGMIYSSVKEIGSYVGNNVSFYTFLTAVNNPRSVLYTIDLSKAPFCGKNCHAYYGTVCSSFVSYALGLVPIMGSYDFSESEMFDKVYYSSPEDLEVADVLWYPGHVALVTGINRSSGKVSSVELCQALGEGCVRRYYTRDVFEELMKYGFQTVFRYNRIENNTEPVIDLVKVQSDAIAFMDSAICANKGDKYCYFEDENVILNIFQDYQKIELWRDGEILKSFENGMPGDLTLDGLQYGKYRAVITLEDGTEGGSTEWIMVNYTVEFEPSNNTLFFSSLNALPESVRLTNKSGGRGYPFTEVLSRQLTVDEVRSGKVTIPENLLKKDCPYFSITFNTDYGRISLRPQPWNE